MPVIMFERVPLPSLRTYTSVSICLFACALLYTHNVLTDVEEESEQSSAVEFHNTLSDMNNETENVTVVYYDQKVSDIEKDGYFFSGLKIMVSTTWCAWTVVNMAYCCLILAGKLTQKIVFGELRVSEQQHLKEKFWNFVFYKFIFIFGVMNVQHMHEVVLWCAWFSLLGCFHLLTQLSKDRFEYLSFSPTTPNSTHVKVLLLLSFILVSCMLMFTACVLVCYLYASLNTFAFMAAECVLLMDKTLHVLVRYAVHLFDLHHDQGVWENKSMYVYYSDLGFELLALSVDFMHHLHMLIWANIFLSMASLVICMQLRYLFHEFQRRLHRHKNYLRVVSSMEERFPLAVPEELAAYDDDCAICWERMQSGRKLPCGHFFHNSCLRSWLEQDTSCPTCRTVLGDMRPAPTPPPPRAGAGPLPDLPERSPNNNHTVNHLFQFDGSRYVSWLPRFSVEVTHTAILGEEPGDQSQLDAMVRQVREVFPALPTDTVRADLRRTHSVQQTLENIIEGNLNPGHGGHSDSSDSGSTDFSDNDDYAGDMPEPLQFRLSDVSEEESRDEDYSPYVQINTAASHSNNPVASLSSEMASTSSSSSSIGQEQGDFTGLTPQAGARFSKSSTEREDMLRQRKQALMESARRKFLSSSNVAAVAGGEPEGHSGTVRRRELLARAAQSRMSSN